MVFCVVVACFITYLSGKFGCDGVIFVGVIVKNIMLVKIAGHAHTHYPVTLMDFLSIRRSGFSTHPLDSVVIHLHRKYLQWR